MALFIGKFHVEAGQENEEALPQLDVLGSWMSLDNFISGGNPGPGPRLGVVMSVLQNSKGRWANQNFSLIFSI